MKKNPKDLFKKSVQKSGVSKMQDLLKAVKSSKNDSRLQNLGVRVPKDIHTNFKFITLKKGLMMQDVIINLMKEYNKKNERFFTK